jgi:hypothetical protein
MIVTEVPEQPKHWMMLPGRRRDPRATFTRSLNELASLLGVSIPAGVYTDREGYWAAKQPVLKEIKIRRPPPDELFAPLMRTAIHDPNPSFNRQFIEPAIRDFGRRRVQSALLDAMRDGTDQDRAGVASAWYWSCLPLSAIDGVLDGARPADFDDVTGLGVEWDEVCLRAFLRTGDIGVRRSIVGILFPRAPEFFAEHLRDLAAEVIRIVHAGDDADMRHRIGAVDLSHGRLRGWWRRTRYRGTG